MKSQREYSQSAIVVATIGWLLTAAIFGALVASSYLFRLDLPHWLLWSFAAGAVISIIIATVVPPEIRCRLAAWLQLFS
jgi:NhaP-type Na+/H+ and K+/H+ antiporter